MDAVTLVQNSSDLKYMLGYSTSQSVSVLQSDSTGADGRGASAPWLGLPLSSGHGSAFHRNTVFGSSAGGWGGWGFGG